MPPKAKVLKPEASSPGKSKAKAKGKAKAKSAPDSEPAGKTDDIKSEAAGSGLQAARALQQEHQQGHLPEEANDEEEGQKQKGSTLKENDEKEEEAIDLSVQQKDEKAEISKDEDSQKASSGEKLSSSGAASPSPPSIAEKAARLKAVPDPWLLVANDNASQQVTDEKWENVLELNELGSASSSEAVASHVVAKAAVQF